MSTPVSTAASPGQDPTPGFLFTCRRTPEGKYTFDAPPEEVAKLYEINAAEMTQMLNAGRIPFIGESDNPELWASIVTSAEQLTPWIGDTCVTGVKTGRVRWVRTHAIPRREPDGGTVWTGVMLEVTDLKASEIQRREALEALARSEAWMRAALSGANMLGWDFDLVANKWTTTVDIPEFYGVPRGPDYSNPETSLTAVHPEDMPIVMGGWQRAIETGEPMRYEFRGRVPMPDGFPRWFSTRGAVMRDENGKPTRLLAVTTDITERKRVEAERTAIDRRLLDAQKWESLGVLAGGVAHDFNNILTVILGSAGLARKGLPPLAPAGMHLDQIEQASRRAADLCRQLLAYAGRGHIATGTTDLNQLVRGSTALLGVPASKSTRVRFDLAESLPTARVDPAQVRQVLVNLVINAAEAIGDTNGEIVIETRAVELASDSMTGFHIIPMPGRYVRLTVSDTGPGIPPEVKARMFDPFFTTKFAGRGLGLSAVLGIMRAHGGAIRVATTPGRGTAVEVLWPVVPDHSQPAAVTALGSVSRGSSGMALVVDDEMYVREVTASTLEELGYRPLLAGDGASALELFRHHRADVRVAVLDMVMPGMTGEQVLEGLRALNADLPSVIVSGFTDKRGIGTGIGTRTEFLQKPFHPEELIAAVKRVTSVSVV
jgi:two-component system, cell cycle sensor histidine kinase and response regulator CckA